MRSSHNGLSGTLRMLLHPTSHLLSHLPILHQPHRRRRSRRLTAVHPRSSRLLAFLPLPLYRHLRRRFPPLLAPLLPTNRLQLDYCQQAVHHFLLLLQRHLLPPPSTAPLASRTPLPLASQSSSPAALAAWGEPSVPLQALVGLHILFLLLHLPPPIIRAASRLATLALAARPLPPPRFPPPSCTRWWTALRARLCEILRDQSCHSLALAICHSRLQWIRALPSPRASLSPRPRPSRHIRYHTQSPHPPVLLA